MLRKTVCIFVGCDSNVRQALALEVLNENINLKNSKEEANK